MPPKAFQLLERAIIAVMLLGIFGMFQPWDIRLYSWGFIFTGLGTLAFIIVGHLPIREED